MNKEPIGLYLFRFILGLGLFAFMALLYWSSLLLENDMKEVKTDLRQLQSDISTLQSKISSAPLSRPAEETPSHELQEKTRTESDQTLALQLRNRPHIDPSLPNLLKEDPFFENVLPKLLGKDFARLGTFHNAILGIPNNLHPFTNWLYIREFVTQCNVGLARQAFGRYETLTPDMAIKIEERKNETTGVTEFWVHLRDGVYWQPLNPDFFSEDFKLAPHFLHKHPVTAYDFKFCLDATLNPYVQELGAVAMRNYYSDIEEIEVIDPLTLIVRWKGHEVKEPDGNIVHKIQYRAKLLTGGLQPLASFVFQYFPDGKKIIEDDADKNTYRTNSVWAQNFAQHWAKNIIPSCGPWLFDGMTEQQIKFKRNPDFYLPYAVLVQRSEVQFKNSPDTIWQEFKANKLDTYEIRPEQMLELEEFMKSPQYLEQKKAGAAINRLEFLDRQYAYIGWNEKRPLFQSKKVRQALTMAIDRQRIIRQILNGKAIETTGTFALYSSAYDDSIVPWPFDVQRARRLLEEEGWYDSNGDGVIDKMIDGKLTDFRFAITYYVKNPTSKNISEYICTALKEVGIACTLNGVDVADISAAFEEKSFDAIQLRWALSSPPEDPKQLWYSKGSSETGSSNAIGFANAEADSIIEALEYEADPEKRVALYHRFDAILHEEAPYVFLYIPKTTLLYRDYVQNVFIPADRQDLVPGANMAEPDKSIFWLRQ